MAGINIIEGIDLRNVSGGRYCLHCFPLSIQGADESPVRAVLETKDLNEKKIVLCSEILLGTIAIILGEKSNIWIIKK